MTRPPKLVQDADAETIAKWFLESTSGRVPAPLKATLDWSKALTNRSFSNRMRHFVEGLLHEGVGGPISFRSDRLFKRWCKADEPPDGPYCRPRELVLHAFGWASAEDGPGLLLQSVRRALVVGSFADYKRQLAFVLRRQFRDPDALDPTRASGRSPSTLILARAQWGKCLNPGGSRYIGDDARERLRASLEVAALESGGVADELLAAMEEPERPLQLDGKNFAGVATYDSMTWIEQMRDILGLRKGIDISPRTRKLADRGLTGREGWPRAVLEGLILPRTQEHADGSQSPVPREPIEVWTLIADAQSEWFVFVGFADETEFVVSKYFSTSS